MRQAEITRLLTVEEAAAALHHYLARRIGEPSDARETALVGAISVGVLGWWVALPAAVDWTVGYFTS